MRDRLVLPWPSSGLSPNARGHWSVRQRESKAARSFAFLAARQAEWGIGTIPNDACRVNLWVRFYPPTKRMPDDDNMLARFKPYRDGIADALGIDDKRFVSRPRVMDEVRKGGCVEVQISLEGADDPR